MQQNTNETGYKTDCFYKKNETSFKTKTVIEKKLKPVLKPKTFFFIKTLKGSNPRFNLYKTDN